MGAMASLITSLTIVYSTVYSGRDQRKHQSSASLVFVWGIHRGPVNSLHKWPVTRKMFPFHDVIMTGGTRGCHYDNLRCHPREQSCHYGNYCVLLPEIASFCGTINFQCSSISILQDIPNKYPIAYLSGWAVGCLLWIYSIFSTLVIVILFVRLCLIEPWHLKISFYIFYLIWYPAWILYIFFF